VMMAYYGDKRQTEAMQICPSNLCPFLPSKLIRILAFYTFQLASLLLVSSAP
jgi:hypothetical protein